MFYTYAHYRADDNRIFYIGKGKGKRHANNKNRNKYWNHVVAKHGFKSEILCHWETEDEAFDHEKFLIKTLKELGHALVNITAGGEGSSGVKPTPESVAKMLESRKWYKHSPEVIARLKEIRKTKVFTPETRAKMSASLKGKPVTLEQRQKLSIARTGMSNPSRWRKVFCETNGVTYESVTSAAKCLNIDKSSISAVCRGDHSHTKGYVFKYA